MYSHVVSSPREFDVTAISAVAIPAVVVIALFLSIGGSHVHEWVIALYAAFLGVYLWYIMFCEYFKFGALHRLKSPAAETLLIAMAFVAILQASRSSSDVRISFLWFCAVLFILFVWEIYTMWKGRAAYFGMVAVRNGHGMLRHRFVPIDAARPSVRHWYEYRYWVVLDGALVFVAAGFWFAAGGVLDIMSPRVASLITGITGTAVGLLNTFRYRVVMRRYRLPFQSAATSVAQGLQSTQPLPMAKFDVALSFPGEKRGFVEQVAVALRGMGLHVFYDHFYESELARPDMDVLLQAIYHDRSRVVAVFLCSEYAAKEWCGLEWRAVRDLIKARQPDTVMLLRFDDTDVPGLFSIDGYVDLRNRAPDDVSELIRRRVASSPRSAAV